MARLQENERKAAYELGLEMILPSAVSDKVPNVDLSDISDSLRRLDLLAPGLKWEVIQAAYSVALFDRYITLKEWECLRALSDIMGCPLPMNRAPSLMKQE